MVMEQDFKFTFRQQVLLKLLRYGEDTKKDTFRKRTFPFTEKEWKFVNSLVDGNCLWFGGNTTRELKREKNVGKWSERQEVHQKELGFTEQVQLITHADKSHRIYTMHKDNIKRYLMAVITKKVTLSKLDKALRKIEEEYRFSLRDFAKREA